MSIGFAAESPASAPTSAVATASWSASAAVATISLDLPTLAALGFEATVVGALRNGHAPHPLSVAPATAPSFAAPSPHGLRVAVAADGFRGFAFGALRFAGGFVLRRGDRAYDFSQLELRAIPGSSAFELADAAGSAWLSTSDSQWDFSRSSGELRAMNADVRISPALANELGEPRYSGITVGVLAVDLTLRRGSVPAATLSAAAAPPPCGDWSGEVDVALVAMPTIAQGGTATVAGRAVVVVLPSAELENVGTANVPWYTKFTNLGQPFGDQHPFLVWQMLRLRDGVLEPLGQSDLKHAFATGNTGCEIGACTDSHILGLGCADFYGTSTNNAPAALAPRSELTAATASWAHCGGIASHFDANGDCVQDFFGAGEDAFTHGMLVAEADLLVPGAQYFVEAFYIVRDDIDVFNSMGYREVAPAKPVSLWTFATLGDYMQGPVINTWVNPGAPGAAADNRVLDTGEGQLQLAVRVLPVPGNPSRHRFAYALQNHDFDRRIRSVHIPFDNAVAAVDNPIFVDGDGVADNDWTPAIGPQGITWTAPSATVPAAELDYASLVSLRFDSTVAGAAACSSLGVQETGEAMTLGLRTMAPATSPAATPGYYTLAPRRLLDTRTLAGGATAIAAGGVRVLDLAGACAVPPGASAVALNVTVIGATSGGEIALYGESPSSGAGRVRFTAGVTRANNAIVALGADGKIRLQPNLDFAGSAHVVLDVVGYFVEGP
jgi:hypothetical protein